MPRSAIVGVVGKSHPVPDTGLLTLAEEIGRRIATAGHVVLTGGHVRGSDESVKHHALLGAKSVAETGSRASLIGILPRDSVAVYTSVDSEPSTLGNGLLRCLFLHTGLKSMERNLITGGAPDVLIALCGTQGTAQEVSYALEAGRTVVFLNSFHCLEPHLRGTQFGPPVDLVQAVTAEEAVAKALEAWDQATRPSQTPRWISKYAELHTMYEEAVDRLGLRGD